MLFCVGEKIRLLMLYPRACERVSNPPGGKAKYHALRASLGTAKNVGGNFHPVE
ncbi:hypothetical protein [Paenibacillus lactis]|uniref:hypothetical protein n=1 Tax=Paenibacillus lactis TaxID=228574 RepID=UPI001642C3E1